MSEVVSFRIDTKNPREARALAVLRAWQEKGYRTRDILTRALLQLEELDSIHEVMDGLGVQLQYLSRKLDRLSTHDVDRSNFQDSTSELSEGFKAALMNKAKPGLMDKD